MATASITVHREDMFPNGTSVSAYPLGVAGVPAAGGAPAGTATETATVSGGAVTFTALAAFTSYILYASSPDRYLHVNTSTTSVAGTGLPAGGTTGQVLAKASNTDGDAGWVATGDVPADASTIAKGVVQLAGDLAGTATSPQIAAKAVGAAEIADALKPSVSAVAATEALRALGTSASTATAGNDARLTDSRAPSGTAGGVLGGTYPNPSFAADMATQAELDTHSADSTAVHGISDTAAVKGVVVWTSGAIPTRPSGFLSVEWIGPADPSSHAIDGDTWVPTA